MAENLFADYTTSHQRRLRTIVQTADWEAILSSTSVLKQLKADTTVPPIASPQQNRAFKYLVKHNAGRVKQLQAEGVTDEKALLDTLGNWETAVSGHDPFPIVFLGLVITLDCNFTPRCLYCNQTWRPRILTINDWKALIQEAASPIPPYIYLTGGEPLLLGADVWGDNGLVSFATKLGSAVNINTNATLITPQVALQLVKVGLSKLHISLDDVDEGIQGELFQDADKVDKVLNGIFNIQIAREILGVTHPVIHINCVLTHRNIDRFPELLRFLLETRRFENRNSTLGLQDFSFHLIPIGGSDNAFLRPKAREWMRFYSQTWAKSEQVWTDYQNRSGVPENKQRPLVYAVPFANPFHRVEHHMDLEEYCRQAGNGKYWQGALTDRCYVAPTQAFVMPDGTQHWCGAHAIQQCQSLGNVQKTGLRGNIRNNIDQFADYPNECCTGCAGATCTINQVLQKTLRRKLSALE